jgi:hypothetical protein
MVLDLKIVVREEIKTKGYGKDYTVNELLGEFGGGLHADSTGK